MLVPYKVIHKNKEDKKKYDKQYRFDNREKIREEKKLYRLDHIEQEKKRQKRNYLQRTYGLSYAEWIGLWESQDGKCVICGISFKNPSDACVDHDHKTDVVRGLLCNKCNAGIGLLNDNPELLRRAIKYIEGEIRKFQRLSG